MRRYVAMIALTLAVFATRETAAANRLLAILPLEVSQTAGKLSKEAESSLEEMLRDIAANLLTPQGWTVLTGETTLQVLLDNGVDPAK